MELPPDTDAVREAPAAEFPHTSRWLDLDAGRMHYVDEGAGPPVVMVHGTPSWSFLYRHLIRCLQETHRCVAPDNLGFGLSDKPPDFPHRPADHTRNLEALIGRLNLRDITLVVHDFGGPIGLGYAVRHPENVHRIVYFNTWAWPLDDRLAYRLGERFLAGAAGRGLYVRANVSPRFLIPLAFGRRERLSPEAHKRYVEPFAHAEDRTGPWRFAVELTRSGPWLERLWARRSAFTDKPSLVMWGMRDPFMRPEFLEKWRGAHFDARIVRYPDVGHFVQEEVPGEVCAQVRAFVDRTA